MAVLSKNQTLRCPRCEEAAPLRVMSSAARRSLGVWEDEEGKRVSRKLQVVSRQEKFSFEFRQRFIVHHHQHLAVQLHWPAETANELIKLTATQRVKHKDYWDINLCPFLHNSSCLWSSGVRVVCAPRGLTAAVRGVVGRVTLLRVYACIIFHHSLWVRS